MKSGSGRYQSRVFSFLSQQTLRWRDRASQAVRHAKIAAAWSLQILLYPLYVTFQTTRLLNRQIGRSIRQTTARLRSAQTTLQKFSPGTETPLLTSDTPLTNTLQHLPPLADQIAQTTIQGIASLLPTQDLVLISSENIILDVMTPEQQSQLQRQIIWQVASYWRQQRLLGNESHEVSAAPVTFLPAISDRPQAWLPIRVLYRLMAWMQLSPVALATDIFAESQLPQATPQFVAQLPASGSGSGYVSGQGLSNEPSLRSADLSWSSLEDLFSDLLPDPLSSENQTYPDTDPKLLASLQATLTGLAQRFTQLATHLVEQSGIVLASPPAVLPSSASPVSRSSTPWLSLTDLFTPARSAALTAASDWETFNPAANYSASIERATSQKITSSAGSQSGLVTPLTSDLTPTRSLNPHHSGKITGKTKGGVVTVDERASQSVVVNDETAIQPVAIDPTDLTLTPPPYIDAEVKLVRYEKHPLEQVLEWLDMGMVWVEETLAQTWKWLRDRLGLKE